MIWDPACLTPILRIRGPVLRAISIDLFVDKILVVKDIPDFSCGVSMVMAAYFLFDIAYPKPLKKKRLNFIEHHVISDKVKLCKTAKQISKLCKL